MTFQQEERRREELRKQEEARQQEARRQAEEAAEAERQKLEAIRRQEEERRRQDEERRRQEEKRRQEEERKVREEERRLQEEKRRQEEERRKQEEERIKQEEKRRQEEERKRQDEERKRLEERRKLEEEKRRIEEERRRQEEERRRQEEQARREMEEQRLRQLELKKAEEERQREELARLKQEEEAMRLEEMRLEQELRRQFELQQQMEQEEMRRREQEELARRQEEQQRREAAEQRAAEARQAQKQAQRSVTPKLIRTKSFTGTLPPPLPLPEKDGQENMPVTASRENLHVKTGNVLEKRNLWMMRSASVERLPQPSLSPAPRRRRIDWGRKDEDREDDNSRPGSSLGQAAHTGSVRNLSSGFIAKSKSSSAVGGEERSRPRARITHGWTKEQEEAQREAASFQEVKTNKVTETVTGWGSKGQTSGRSTPVPSRTIGEVHAENRVAKAAADEKSANSWRSAAQEPSVKLVNVTVEKGTGSAQNIHISENAHSQMASFIGSETVTKTRTNTMSSASSSKSMMSSSSVEMSGVAPPAPARSTSHGVAVRYLSQ